MPELTAQDFAFLKRHERSLGRVEGMYAESKKLREMAQWAKDNGEPLLEEVNRNHADDIDARARSLQKINEQAAEPYKWLCQKFAPPKVRKRK